MTEPNQAHDLSPDPLYTFTEAAAAFSMKPRTWRELFNTRALPLVRIGRRLYVRRSEVLAYLAAQTIPVGHDTEADQ